MRRPAIWLIALAGLLILPVMILFFLSTSTSLKLEPAVKVLGTDTSVRVLASNPHGLRHFTASIEQDGVRHPIHEIEEPASRFMFWRQNHPPREIRFPAAAKKAGVKDGKARLILESVSNDLRGRADTLVTEVEVNTRPPAISVDGLQHYINQGGAELVLFTVSGYWTESGVRVGKYSFRSFPFPGKSGGERFSLFAFPWDVPPDTVAVAYARNPAGAEVTAKFWQKIFPKPFRSRRLDIDDSFLNKVVPSIDPGGSGPLLERFLKINGQLRRENNETLAKLREQTEEKILWSGPFVQLTNSKVESQFADARTYVYQGKDVDRQVHLGFDLSVTKNMPVTASNDGIVRYASDLGIYGNAVVIDHGYGLQSIYGHLSKIDVKPGDAVKKSQPIGLSGATGLAGGDHLHYTMQIDGVQVNPVEWWDAHWIQDRILSKLPAPAQ